MLLIIFILTSMICLTRYSYFNSTYLHYFIYYDFTIALRVMDFVFWTIRHDQQVAQEEAAEVIHLFAKLAVSQGHGDTDSKRFGLDWLQLWNGLKRFGRWETWCFWAVLSDSGRSYTKPVGTDGSQWTTILTTTITPTHTPPLHWFRLAPHTPIATASLLPVFSPADSP